MYVPRNGEYIYALRDTVTRLRRKDYKPQLQADVYAAAECSDPRSAESSSWTFSKCKPSCQSNRGRMLASLAVSSTGSIRRNKCSEYSARFGARCLD